MESQYYLKKLEKMIEKTLMMEVKIKSVLCMGFGF